MKLTGSNQGHSKSSDTKDTEEIYTNTDSFVYPCCCGIKPKTFFKVFTIMIIVDQFLKMTGYLVSLFSKFDLFHLFAVLVCAFFCAWACYVYYEFIKHDTFGSINALFFSLGIMILTSVLVAGFIFYSILTLFLDLEILPEIKKINPMAFNLVLFLLVIPFFLYGVYLTVVYYLVVQKERRHILKRNDRRIFHELE